MEYGRIFWSQSLPLFRAFQHTYLGGGKIIYIHLSQSLPLFRAFQQYFQSKPYIQGGEGRNPFLYSGHFNSPVLSERV